METFQIFQILLGYFSLCESAGSLDLMAKFTISTTANPSLLCSSQLPSCVPKGFFLNITVKINKYNYSKMGKVPSVMPISRINWIPKTKGSHGVYFERKIKLSTIPPPVNGLELLLDLTPNCSAKCGKSVQQASGVFPIQLQSYKQTLEVADFFTLTRSTSFQVTAGITYTYKCLNESTGSNCNCLLKKNNCGSHPFICKSKSSQLCCNSVLKDEGFICYKPSTQMITTSTTKLFFTTPITTTSESSTAVTTTSTADATTSTVVATTSTAVATTSTADATTSTAELNITSQTSAEMTATNEILAILENLTSEFDMTTSSQFSPQSFINDTKMDEPNQEILLLSEDKKSDKVSMIVGITLAAIVVGLATFVGLGTLIYRLLIKRQPRGQTVTFYYEDGPYAEIDSEKWQNIVSLCKSMDEVEGEIRKSMMALSQSSTISRPKSTDKSIFDPNYKSTPYAKPNKKSKSFKRAQKETDQKSIGDNYKVPIKRYRTKDKDEVGVGTSLFEEIKEAEDRIHGSDQKNLVVDYSELAGGTYNYITSSFHYLNKIPKSFPHEDGVYQATTEPVYDCVYNSDSEEANTVANKPVETKPGAITACGSCKKCAKLHRKSVAKSMPSLHEFESNYK